MVSKHKESQFYFKQLLVMTALSQTTPITKLPTEDFLLQYDFLPRSWRMFQFRLQHEVFQGFGLPTYHALKIIFTIQL